MVITNKISERRIDWKHNQFNGGFRAYWKIYLSLYGMLKTSGFAKLTTWLNFYTFQFVWFCILKPFGQFLSTTTHIKGSYRLFNGVMENNSPTKSGSLNVSKTVTYKLFGIFIWRRYNQEFTAEEIKELMK